MTARLNPYLNWRDSARDAMEFYRSVFGGELTINSFDEMGAGDAYPGEGHKIMHSQLEAPNGLVLMGADVPSSMALTEGTNVSISLSGGPEDEATLTEYFKGLSEGGTVVEPLSTAPWGDTFGMLKDRFGINWLVNIGAQQS
ncbi:VOC family protein [Thalassiella azotivora]